jgi:putative restriction endonuclease
MISPTSVSDLDHRVRLAAFEFLEQQCQLHGETALPRDVLARGFVFEGTRVPLLAPQGIFKPAILELPLSITTVPPVEGKPRPYDDDLDPSGLLRYRYRGTDPTHRDNAGLREVMRQHIPLVYLLGIVPGRYMPSWPAYIVGDDPLSLTFTVAVDDRQLAFTAPATATAETEIRRRYVTRLVRQRLHQQAFRERVLSAYREHCAICHPNHDTAMCETEKVSARRFSCKTIALVYRCVWW